MYTPAAFRIDDPSVIQSFIKENSFGILLSSDTEGEIQDTHTPFLFSKEDKCLLGHIAKANSQWRAWKEKTAVKVIFHGPHCYVSPNFYHSDFNVPTWNYTAVSIRGEVEIIDELDEQKAFMRALIADNESNFAEPWMLDESDERLMGLFSAVVFFKIRIRSMDAKFKLNQNKSLEDQGAVIGHLDESSSSNDREVAQLMRNLSEK